MGPASADVYHRGEHDYQDNNQDVEHHHMVQTSEVVPIQVDTIPPERSTLRILQFQSVPTLSRGQSLHLLIRGAVEASGMNTAAVSAGLACLRSPYSRTPNLPGPADLVKELDWSAQVLPQYYEYRAAHGLVQPSSSRFTSTSYPMVTDHIAELGTALAQMATPAAPALANPYPVGIAPVL